MVQLRLSLVMRLPVNPFLQFLLTVTRLVSGIMKEPSMASEPDCMPGLALPLYVL